MAELELDTGVTHLGQAVIPYYLSQVKFLAGIAPESLAVGGINLAAATQTNFIAGTPNTRIYVLHALFSVSVASEIQLHAQGRVGMYIDVLVSANTPTSIDLRPCGFNKGFAGDGLDLWSSNATGVWYNIFYLTCPTIN